MPEDRLQESEPQGEILSPVDPPRDKFWRDPQVRIIVGGAVLGGTALWCGSQFFQLRGYVSITASRIDLAAVAGCLIAWIWIWARNLRPPKVWLPTIATVFILGAVLLVDEITLPRNIASFVPTTTPVVDLQLDFDHGVTIVATMPKQKNPEVLLVASGALTNRKGVETGTTNWQMWLDNLHDGRTLHGRMIPNLPTGTDAYIPIQGSKGAFVMEPSRYFPELTSAPVKVGSISMGWIWCEFPITLVDFDKEPNAELHIQFDDIVTGKTHETSVSMAHAKLSKTLPWFQDQKQ